MHTLLSCDRKSIKQLNAVCLYVYLSITPSRELALTNEPCIESNFHSGAWTSSIGWTGGVPQLCKLRGQHMMKYSQNLNTWNNISFRRALPPVPPTFTTRYTGSSRGLTRSEPHLSNGTRTMTNVNWYSNGEFGSRVRDRLENTWTWVHFFQTMQSNPIHGWVQSVSNCGIGLLDLHPYLYYSDYKLYMYNSSGCYWTKPPR